MSHEFFTVNEINSFESGGTQESTNQYKEVERGGGTADSGAAQGSQVRLEQPAALLGRLAV